MIYQVQDPNGQIHEIEGPEGASPEEVMDQAQQLLPTAEDPSKNAEKLEPGVYGETRPFGQKLLENSITALSGATLPSAAAGLVKGATGLTGKAVEGVPGFGNTGEYLNRFAQNQMIKNVGGVRGQIHQLGPDKARAIADYMFEKGMAGPLTGSVGMEQNIANAAQNVGGKLGALRGSANQPHIMADTLAAIKAKLDPQILTGARSGESGVYQKALEELGKLGEKASPADVAKKVTLLNQEAKNLNSLRAPSGAMAEVAKELRNLNDAKIRGALSPEKAAEYDKLLGEYSKIKPIEAMERRGTERDMASRGGTGLLHGGLNKIMDVVGHKTLASSAKNIANQIKAPLTQNIENVVPGVALGAQTLGPWQQQLEDYLKSTYGR